MLLKHPSFEFKWWESLISPWFLKVMNDVWEGNNAAQAFMKKKKKAEATEVTLEKLRRKTDNFKP